MTKKTKTGFTLIELLVVISIIGVLVTIAVANLVSARERARDAARKQQMNELKTALRLFYNDNEEFPAAEAGAMKGCGPSTLPIACIATAPFSIDFPTYTNVYMEQLPLGAGDELFIYDIPTKPAVSVDYQYRAKILLENAGDSDIVASQARCEASGDSTYYYVCEK